MARLLSIELIEKSSTLRLIKKLRETLQSFDQFTKLMVLTVTLILVSTPFIVSNRQIFNPAAQQLVDESLCPSIPSEQGIEKPNPDRESTVSELLSEAHKSLEKSKLRNEARQFATSRKPVLVELMRSNPDQALEYIISNSQKQELSAVGVPSNCIESQETIEGTLEILHQDFFEEGKSIDKYTIVTSENKRISIHPAKGFDLGNTPHTSGVNLKISGYRLDNDFLFDGSKKENINVLPPKKSSMNSILAQPAYANHDEYHTKLQEDANKEQKVAVLMINFQDIASPPSGFNKANVNDLVFNQLKNFYTENSYGKIPNITGNIFPASQEWYALPENSNCVTFGSAVSMADSEVNFAEYDRLILVSPISCGSAFIGKVNLTTQDGIVPISVAWVGINKPNPSKTFFHEFGHQLGVHHAHFSDCNVSVIDPNGCLSDEYDYFNVMGWRAFHLDASHKDYLGWLGNSNIQAVTTSGIYTIEPIETNTGGLKAIKIPHLRNSDSLYLEYRQPIGFDSTGLDFFGNKISLDNPVFQGGLLRVFNPGWAKTQTLLLDASPPIANILEKDDVVLHVDQSLTDYASGTTIKVLEKTASALKVDVTFNDIDLAVSSIGASGATNSGEAISFSGDIKNQGGGKIDIHIPQRLRIDYDNDGTWDIFDGLTDNVLLGGATETVTWDKNWILVGNGNSTIASTTSWTPIGIVPAGASEIAIGVWASNFESTVSSSNFSMTFGNTTCIRSMLPWLSNRASGSCLILNNLSLDKIYEDGFSSSYYNKLYERDCDFRYTAATRAVEFKDISASKDCAFVVFSDSPMLAQEGIHNLEICADPEDIIAESDESNNCATKIFTIPPLILDPIGDKTVSEGQPLTAKVKATANNPSGITFQSSVLPTGAYFVPLGDVSLDGAVSITDASFVSQFEAGTRTLSALQQKVGDMNHDGILTNADADLVTQLVIGFLPPQNEYWFLWQPTYYQAGSYPMTFTVTDGTLSDSESITISVTDVPLPDLTLTALSISIKNTSPGSKISVSSSVKNQGTLSAGSSITSFHLSKDQVYGGTDDIILTGTRTISSLSVGTTNTGSTTVTIPSTAPLGTYFICAMSDSGLALTEEDENNNARCIEPAITVALPDVAMTALSGPATGSTGTTISVTSTVTNQGLAAISSFVIRFYLSLNSTITTSDIYIGNRSVSSLGVGSASTAITALSVPSNMIPGTYYIGAIADYNNQRPESNETNNVLTGNQIVVSPGADLIITTVSGPSTAVRGTSISVTSATKNQGIGTSPNSSTRIYLSTDPTITTADISIGTRSITSLTAGQVNTGTNTITLSSTLPAGTYYLGAIADYNKKVVESNETNNSLAGNTMVITMQ